MENILKDHTNVDDILVYSATAKEHEKHLSDVMSMLEKKHVNLNPEKCELRRSEIEFLGQHITKDGVSPDPKKVQALRNIPDPTNIAELRRILGMINFLGK